MRKSISCLSHLASFNFGGMEVNDDDFSDSYSDDLGVADIFDARDPHLAGRLDDIKHFYNAIFDTSIPFDGNFDAFDSIPAHKLYHELLKMTKSKSEAGIYHAAIYSLSQMVKGNECADRNVRKLVKLRKLDTKNCETVKCRICACQVHKDYLVTHSEFCRDAHVKFHALGVNSNKLKKFLDATDGDLSIRQAFQFIVQNKDPLSTKTMSFIEAVRRHFSEHLKQKRGDVKFSSAKLLLTKRIELVQALRVLMLCFRATQVTSEYQEVDFQSFQSFPETDHNLSSFEIMSPIARGAYGRVTLCRKIDTGDLFALKCIEKPDLDKRNGYAQVMAERESMMRVVSSHLVRLFYTFQADNYLYLVMEFMPGGDLFALLQNVGSLTEETAKFYASEIAAAIAHLQYAGIIHRDIKPDNLLIDEAGHIKLGDFGLSKLAFKVDDKELGDDVSVAAGTPEYLAPEILRGQQVTGAADWWSFGILLYEMVEGSPPFTGDTTEEIFRKASTGAYEWSVEVSDELRDLVAGLLKVDPDERFTEMEVTSHPWFSGVEWTGISRESAPFTPTRTSATDLSYFESARHSMVNSFSTNDLQSMSEKGVENYYNLWDGANYFALHELNLSKM